jgi:hypothetical protein
MSLVKVGDMVLLDFKSVWFLWEPAWERYRPITALAWDGSSVVLDDRAYCADPLDPLYGYGGDTMLELCTILSQMYPPSTAPVGLLPAVGPKEWFYDRFLSLTRCAPRDRASWKRFHKGRYRTPRKAPKTRLTRRVRRQQ